MPLARDSWHRGMWVWGLDTDRKAHASESWRGALQACQEGVPGDGMPPAFGRGVRG